MVVEEKTEKLVVSWLKSHGYHHVMVESDHSTIEADGATRRMVVAVRTPETRNKAITQFLEMATKKNREGWVAVVEEDDDIIWLESSDFLAV